MDITERVELQRIKIGRLIDEIEHARLNEGLTSRFAVFVRDELNVICNELDTIKLEIEKNNVAK